MNKIEYLTIKRAAEEIDGLLLCGYEIHSRDIRNQSSEWYVTTLKHANGNIITISKNPTTGIIEVQKNRKTKKTIKL